MSIKKAVIPAAGLGTRFLPATKSQPKEMLPVVDTPAIQYIVQEAIDAGIEDIIIITGRGKRSLEDHFDRSIELEMELEGSGKLQELEMVRRIGNTANIFYVRQKEPLGLGHAVLMARPFIGDDPFAVLLGDDVVASRQPCIGQMIEIYDKYHSSILGVQTVEHDQISKYGAIDGETVEDRVYLVNDMVEKPPVDEAPSNIAALGRYILTPKVFDYLETQEPGKGGEIQLTDALRRLAKEEKLFAYDFKGHRYDLGSKVGFLRANIEFALRRPDMRQELEEYLSELVKDTDSMLDYE